MEVKVGLYRHFKGNYYFVNNVVNLHDGSMKYVYYFNIMHPERGYYVRPLEDFCACSDIKDGKEVRIVDREDNITGQIYRFEKVNSLESNVKNLSTESLVKELSKREDSPLQELDIESVSKNVFSRDFVVGEAYEETKEYPKGVATIAGFNTRAEALKYYYNHKLKSNSHIYKRVFIKEL